MLKDRSERKRSPPGVDLRVTATTTGLAEGSTSQDWEPGIQGGRKQKTSHSKVDTRGGEGKENKGQTQAKQNTGPAIVGKGINSGAQPRVAGERPRKADYEGGGNARKWSRPDEGCDIQAGKKRIPSRQTKRAKGGTRRTVNCHL